MARSRADQFVWDYPTGGTWDQTFPDPYGGTDSPWKEETPFGAENPPPGAGDTAVLGSADAYGLGTTGITITGTASVATLEAGDVTLNGTFTASTAMEFSNPTLAGGSYTTVALGGGVAISGASVVASGDSDVVVNMTNGATLQGTTATSLSGTVDASIAVYSGAANAVMTVQDGGSLTTGSGTSGGVTVTGGGSLWLSNGTASASIQVQNGGMANTGPMSLDGVGPYAGSGSGITVTGAGSTWTATGNVTMDQVGTDFSTLTVSQAGTITLNGTFGVGTVAQKTNGGGEIFVQDSGSTMTINSTMSAPNAAVEVTNGGVLTDKGDVLLDFQGAALTGSFLTGTGSLWHVTGDMTLGYTSSDSAFLYIGSSGLLKVDGNLYLADTSVLSTATLSTAGANAVQVGGDAIIGKTGNGELDIVGGNGTGSGVSIGGDLYIGGSSSNTGSGPLGTVFVSQQGALALTGSAGVFSGNIMLSSGSNDIGEFFATGAGATATTSGSVLVGLSGPALAGITLGATVTTGATAVEPNETGNKGELDVFDPGSVWTCKSLEAIGNGVGDTNSDTVIIGVNNYGVLRVLSDMSVSNPASIYVSKAVPANTNTAFKYGLAPSDTTHPAGRIYVGTDAHGPDGAIRVGHNGTLYGQAKTMHADVVVGAGGVFKPGNGEGKFNVTGDCDLDDAGAGGGETDVQLGGSDTPGTDYDQLVVSGTVTLGGTLNVALKDGYKPVAGDKFHIIQTDKIEGSFAKIVSPGLTLLEEKDEDGLTLEVSEVAVGSPPDITSPSAASTTVGKSFTYRIVADNAPYKYGATGLPAGLKVNTSTGLISGTPEAAGIYNVALAATNSTFEADGALELTVNPAPPAGSPVITSSTSVMAEPGTALMYQITASNTATSFAASGLPVGLTLNATTGLISGEPKKAGTYTVTLSATNDIGTGTATLVLDILPPVVKVEATVPQVAAGSGKDGEITFSIPAAQKMPLTIHYQVGGTAIPGTDYVRLSGTAKIKAGMTSKVVKIKPLGDLDGAASKIVKLTLEKATDYTLGGKVHAKVKIVAGK